VTGLLGASGLSLEDVEDEARRRKNLKLSSDLLADAKWLDEIIRYCAENGVAVPAAKDSGSDLQKAIENGFPQGNHLIIITDLADKRRTLFKAISNAGMVLDCSVPKGNRREDKMARDLVLNERMKAILGRSGKTMDRGAYQAMCEMIGFDLRTFSNNLEKLISYVGTRKKISAEDVASVLKRTKQDPIYELTSAISERNVEDALFFLDSLLAAGFFPLQVLGAIINQVRKMLLVKGFVESSEGKVWKPGLSYQQFQARVMPAAQEYDKELLSQLETWVAMLSKADDEGDGKKKKKGRKKKSKPVTDVLIAKNPRSVYPVYLMLQKSEKFTTPGLLEAMEKLSQADLRLKTTGQNPKIILEDAIFHICR
jgi:DNA polymerase-3 subunit delta